MFINIKIFLTELSQCGAYRVKSSSRGVIAWARLSAL